ncbi:MAG: trypsin-like serine protease [Burkholderiales bacterium]
MNFAMRSAAILLLAAAPVAHAQRAEPILLPRAVGASPALAPPARADALSFPFVVALVNAGGGVMCSGTLLNPRGKILTAARCFCDPSSQPTHVRIGRSVYATDKTDRGELTLQRELAPGAEFLDEGYCAKRGFDLAIAATREPLDQALAEILGGLHVATPKAPYPDPDFKRYPLGAYLRAFQSGKPVEVYTVGFGETEVAAKGGGAKRYARLKVLPCAPGQPGCMLLMEYFAPEQDGAADTCRGDSGGPVLEREDGTGWLLFAVTSRSLGDRRDKYCGGGGVYVSVLSPRVQDWLGRHIDAH